MHLPISVHAKSRPGEPPSGGEKGVPEHHSEVWEHSVGGSGGPGQKARVSTPAHSAARPPWPQALGKPRGLSGSSEDITKVVLPSVD